jgi:predicted permease
MWSMGRLWRRLVRSVRAGTADEELDRELVSHIALMEDEYRRRGLSAEQAERAARRAFGAVEAVKERHRDERAFRWIGETWQDLRYAARWLSKRPGFAVASVVILALAIGVNATFFSLYGNYVLKPLPIRGVERHVSISASDRTGRSLSTWSPSEVESLRQSAGRGMEGFYTSDTFQVLAVAPLQRQAMVTSVSGEYFPLLGGTAILGRTLTGTDEDAPVAVLSSSGAARFFSGQPNPVGQTLRVRTIVLTVIGVMPPTFRGAVAVVPDLWVGVGTEDALRRGSSPAQPRRKLFGLLAPEASAERVQSVLTVTAAHFPRPQEEVVARVDVRAQRSLLGGEEVDAAAVLLFAAFLMVLFIACANLANLHLARASTRTHEIAMRLSLGASRWRVVRQLLTESTSIALLGAAAGCALAIAGVQQFYAYAISLSGVGGVITLPPVAVDWRVLLYSVALGLGAGLLVGLLPAIEFTTPSLTPSTKGKHSSFAGRIRPRRMRNSLIGGQVAASLVLLIVGGVLIQNIQRLDAVDPGYDLDRVFTLRLNPPDAATLALLEQQRGVAAVTAVARVPLSGAMWRLPVTAEGRMTSLAYNYVDHRYFETLALPVEGRSFTVAETSGRAQVAVINRATARTLWTTGAPLGRTFAIDATPERLGAAGVYQVVGVVPDVVSGWLFEGRDSPAIYLPAAAGQAGMESAMVRITGDPVKTVAAIRDVCAGVATGCEPASLRGAFAVQRFPFQIVAGAAGALGGVGLLLTAIGLYSVASYSVIQRKREIGILLALGASSSQVIRRILAGAWLGVVLGVALGMPVCLGLSKLAANSVFQIQTFDLGAYLSVPLLLTIIVTLACAGPARRAVRMNPMVSLRDE